MEGLARLRGSKPSTKALVKASIYIQDKQCTGGQLPRETLHSARLDAHSISTCSAALIRISGFPLYISIRPVIFTRLPSIPNSSGDLFTGDAGGIQPVNVWWNTRPLREWLQRSSLLKAETLSSISAAAYPIRRRGRRKIGWNNGRGLSLNERRTTAGQNGCHKE
jgi:hypothetical protein